DADEIFKNGRICGLFGSAKALFMAVLSEKFKNTLIVTSTTEEAEKIFDDIRYFLDGSAAELFLLETHEASGRIPALRALSSDKKAVIIASLNAALKETYSPEGLRQASIRVQEKNTHRIDELARRFFGAGFLRQTMVEAPGEIAVRGGIVDIFPLSGKPLRVEFDGDAIASIRNFDPLTQRSTQRIKESEILPAEEKGSSNAFEYCKGENCAVFADDQVCSVEAYCLPGRQAGNTPLHAINFYTLGSKEKCVRVEAMIPENYALRSEKFFSDIRETKNKVFVVTNQDERISELLQELPPKKDPISVVRGQISGGFILPDLGLAVYSDKEIYGEKYFQRKFKAPKEETPSKDLYVDYKEGDFVVHKDHGIGIYKGVEPQTFGGVTSDYLFIQYLGQDKLYVPVRQMHKVLKYRSAGEYIPKLNTLGGADWQVARKKAKASAKKL
ncbi:MAG: CarD family transcriptional regulator, partial [Candidatus Margulisiibacteriota bacterium]